MSVKQSSQPSHCASSPADVGKDLANKAGWQYLNPLLQKLESEAVYQYWLLAVITVVAASLRFYKLGEWSFWIEEHHSLRHTAAIDSILSAVSAVRPLFYLLLKPVFAIWGVSEWTARLVPAIIGIVTVPVVYGLTKRLFGFWIAFLSAALLAIAPWHLYWSQNARFYSLLLLLYTVSLFAFYWGVETDRFRYIIISIVLLGLAVISHPIAALLLPLYLIYFLLLKILPFAKPIGLRWRNILAFFLIPLGGYLIFDSLLIFFLDRQPLALALYRQFFGSSSAAFIGYRGPYIMLTAVIYYIGTPLTMLALTGAFFLVRRKERIGLLLSIGAFFPLLVMMTLTFFASTANRYVFMSLACWVILAAVGVREMGIYTHRRWSVWLLVLGVFLFLARDPVLDDVRFFIGQGSYMFLLLPTVVLIILLYLLASQFFQAKKQTKPFSWIYALLLLLLLIHPLATDSMYYAYQHGHRDNIKAAAAIIQQEKLPGDAFASSVPNVAAYYLNERIVDANHANNDDLIQQNQRLWYMRQFDANPALSAAIDEWVAANCDLRGTWDNYVAGQPWKMRVYLCTAQHQSS